MYDAYTETELPFKSDCFVFPNDIGTESNHNSLKKLVYEILRLLGQDSHSLEDKWDIIENEAYIKSRRITTEEFIEKLKTINSQVTVTGLYKGYKRKSECLCLLRRSIYCVGKDALNVRGI